MPSPWIPVLASVLLCREQVLKIKIFSKELALWRSASGRVQLWENRCPHRSVRFSIGKVVGENLICAYHGWAFSADSARCQKIPAQPQQRAPQSLCAKSYNVEEQQGMIWFAGFEPQPLAPLPIIPQAAALHYAGSIMITCTQAALEQHLCALGFAALHPYVWQGSHPQHALSFFVSPNQADKQHLHLLSQSSVDGAFGVELLLKLRDELEQSIEQVC